MVVLMSHVMLQEMSLQVAAWLLLLQQRMKEEHSSKAAYITVCRRSKQG